MDNTVSVVKRYFISSLVTFLAAVAMVLLANWDQITLNSFKDGAVFGLVFLALRAGVKALLEAFVARKATG